MAQQPQGDPASPPPAHTFTHWPALPHGLNQHQSETNPIKRFPELGVSSMIHSHSFSLLPAKQLITADGRTKEQALQRRPPLSLPQDSRPCPNPHQDTVTNAIWIMARFMSSQWLDTNVAPCCYLFIALWWQ